MPLVTNSWNSKLNNLLCPDRYFLDRYTPVAVLRGAYIYILHIIYKKQEWTGLDKIYSKHFAALQKSWIKSTLCSAGFSIVLQAISWSMSTTAALSSLSHSKSYQTEHNSSLYYRV